VFSAGDFMSFRVQPLRAEVGAEILKIPGVERPPSGQLAAARMTKMQVDGREVLLEAYDDPVAPGVRKMLFQSEDAEIGKKVAELFESPALVLLASDGFLRQSKKKIGDHVKLPTPGGAVEGKIIGVVNDFSFAGGSLYLDRKKYQAIWKDGLVTVFGVKVLPGYDLEEVRRAIDGKLGRSRDLLVMKNTEMQGRMSAELDRSLAFMDALQYGALLVILISLVNTFLVTILERRREIGMLRAVGMSRSQLAVSLLSECISQGLVCAALTLLVGVPITYLWVKFSLSNLLGWTLQFHFPWMGLVEIFGAGLLVSALAALIPIIHATRIQITEALRYE
jgi:putative ABC transport system permease protein